MPSKVVALFGILVAACAPIVEGRSRSFLQKRSPFLHNNHSLNNDSHASLQTSNDSDVGLRSHCSFSGPSWDPLRDCFPVFGTFDAAPAVQKQLLCKLKAELAIAAAGAWSFLQDAINGSNTSGTVHSGGSFKAFRAGRSFRTCSVVSNSGVLQRHSHGSAIDSAEFVLRFNDAPIRYWAQQVGSRDDARITNQKFPTRVLNHATPSYTYQSSTYIGLIPFLPPPRLQEFRAMYPTADVNVLDLGLVRSFSRTLRGIYGAQWFQQQGVSFEPTSGGIGMLSALVACDQVKAYGMAATETAQLSPYHYYGHGGSATRNSWHKTFSAEKDLWRRVAQNSAAQIDLTDVAVIPGFSQIQCPAPR